MSLLPIYKFKNHEHDFSSKNEVIEEYIDYYNCYNIKIKRIYK